MDISPIYIYIFLISLTEIWHHFHILLKFRGSFWNFPFESLVSELRPQEGEGTQHKSGFCEAFLRCVEKKMGAINSELEELFEAKKRVKNPYVPIGISSIPLFFPTHMRLHTDIYMIYLLLHLVFMYIRIRVLWMRWIPCDSLVAKSSNFFLL